ncbi:MAG: HAD family hydrolase [Candidatus Velthaea sp.]
MRRIQGVGFDFDHTLGLDRGLEAEGFTRLAAELGTPISFAREPWTSTIAGLLARFRGGELSSTEMVAQFCAALERRADPCDRAPRWREICCGLVDAHVIAVPGACEALAELRARGVPIAILTNGWSPLQERKIARALGAFPEPVLVSETLGLAKPAAGAFVKLADALGVARERVAYVGDNPLIDAAAAQAAGLIGVWFDGEGIAAPAGAPPADYVIRRLAELATLVPGRAAATENLIS